MDNIKQLCGFIVEKHKRFLSQYKIELANLDRILVLQEEIDQFNHWITSGELSYNEKKAKALAELNSLVKNNPKKISSKRLEGVRSKISDHEAALQYWDARAGEVAHDQIR